MSQSSWRRQFAGTNVHVQCPIEPTCEQSWSEWARWWRRCPAGCTLGPRRRSSSPKPNGIFSVGENTSHVDNLQVRVLHVWKSRPYPPNIVQSLCVQTTIVIYSDIYRDDWSKDRHFFTCFNTHNITFLISFHHLQFLRCKKGKAKIEEITLRRKVLPVHAARFTWNKTHWWSIKE